MRCYNCGWENTPGHSHCEKCNAPLQTENEASSIRRTVPASTSKLNATVRDEEAFNKFKNIANQKDKLIECPSCGYNFSSDMKSCPNCGVSIEEKSTEPIEKDLPIKKNNSSNNKCPNCNSVVEKDAHFCSNCGFKLKSNQVDDPLIFFTLKPIAWEKEEVQYKPVTYSGETIVLNRANTDSNNQSISPKEQAILTFENGSWYIENRSEKGNTMIKIRKKTKLQTGDIIALGNRTFEFKG